MSGAKLTRCAGLSILLHRHPLLVMAASVALGILLDVNLQKHTTLGRTPIGILIWIGLFLLLALAIWRLPARWRLIATALLMMPIAAIRYQVVDADHRSVSILQIVSDAAAPAVIEGHIDRPVVLRRHPLADQMTRRDQSPWQTVAQLRVLSARVGQRQQPFDGRALIVIDGKRDEFLPGDHVRVFGWASRFSGPTNPGEGDLRDVYRRQGLHIRVNVNSPQQLIRVHADGDASSRHPLWILYRGVAKFARHSRDILLRNTDATTGPLAVALVIGQRDFVDHQTRDALLVTGTAHLLSVSGLHLAIIVMLAGAVATLLRFPASLKLFWILGVCILYTAITGGRPPVVRACLLVATLMFSLMIRRPSQPLNSLALAAILLLCINPELLFSIGVQLSFLAVATLLMCGRRHDGTAARRASRQEQRLDELVQGSRPRWIRWSRFAAFGFGQMAWFSGCVTAISMPLVWHQFHVLSPISVVTNVILWPLLFVSLAAGVATVLVGWIYDPLAAVPGWICDVSVFVMRWVIETATAVPWGHFWFPAPPGVWVTTFYVVLMALIWWRPRATGLPLRCGWIVIWMSIALFVSTRPSDLPADTIEATWVDVGHGTCVVLRLDVDHVWLYDCGRLGNDTGSSRDIDATLWSMGVTRLRGIILSHADSDHYNALPGVIRRFGVGKIVTPPGMLDEEEQGLEKTRRSIAAAGIPVEEMAAGGVITSASRQMFVLHPPQDRVPGSDNANSLVLRVDQGGRTLILPGDLEPPGTIVLVDQDRPSPGGVLMAPHHGSLRMDAATVLQWARPRETVVSGGERATRPEVKEMLSAAGSGVHITAQHGAIRVRIDGSGKIHAETWKETPWPAY